MLEGEERIWTSGWEWRRRSMTSGEAPSTWTRISWGGGLQEARVERVWWSWVVRWQAVTAAVSGTQRRGGGGGAEEVEVEWGRGGGGE
jgi:hypothetical protein